MVTIRSPRGIHAERAFKNVVFPLPVPPETKMFFRARTHSFKNSASSAGRGSKAHKPFQGKRLFPEFADRDDGPSSATARRATLTREPSASLASAMGSASFTVRFTLETICWITSPAFLWRKRPFHFLSASPPAPERSVQPVHHDLRDGLVLKNS